MSLTALAMVLGHAVIFSITRESDEGTAAHIFQFLMVGQVPAVAFFAMKWLPRQPSQALRVMAVQVSAGLIAVAAAYWLT